MEGKETTEKRIVSFVNENISQEERTHSYISFRCQTQQFYVRMLKMLCVVFVI